MRVAKRTWVVRTFLGLMSWGGSVAVPFDMALEGASMAFISFVMCTRAMLGVPNTHDFIAVWLLPGVIPVLDAFEARGVGFKPRLGGQPGFFVCPTGNKYPLSVRAVGIAGSALGAGVAGRATRDGGEGCRRTGACANGPEALLKNFGAALKSCS